MRHRFDHLGKDIGEAALGPCGLTVLQDEIAPDAHHADLRHEPVLARREDRARLGLLGRIASILCLIELYSGALDEDEMLACIGKLIAFRQKRRRDARKKRRRAASTSKAKTKPPAPFVRPFVWIFTARRPTRVLCALGAAPAPRWPRGVYFSPGVLCRGGGRDRLTGLNGAAGLLRVGIVVARELPRERSTILVRLMAAGPVLREAIAELRALPRDAYERGIADDILLKLRNAVLEKSKQTQQEQEFIVSTQSLVKKLRNEGRAEEAARAVLTVLRVRGIAVSSATRDRIRAQKDPGLLERWLAKAAVAVSLAEVLGDPS